MRTDSRTWALDVLERTMRRLTEADGDSIDEELVLFARGLNGLDRALAQSGLPALPAALAGSLRLDRPETSAHHGVPSRP